MWIATAAVGAALLIALAASRARGGLAAAAPAIDEPPARTVPGQDAGAAAPQVPGAPVPGHLGAAARGDRAGPGSSPASATSRPAAGPGWRKGDAHSRRSAWRSGRWLVLEQRTRTG
jgi:hypothetical protein